MSNGAVTLRDLRSLTTVIVTCVNYADFLALTLPTTSSLFESVLVVTSPTDTATIELARAFRCSVHATTVWNHGGAKFNKAGAINEALDTLETEAHSKWMLLLDADILMPSEFVGSFVLDPRNLYSARRRICASRLEYERLRNGTLLAADLPLDSPAIRNGKVWGWRPTSNPAALCGYFQLWNRDGGCGLKRMPPSENASKYDVEFALSFPEGRREYIPVFDVIHLGEQKVNWNGRQSGLWVE